VIVKVPYCIDETRVDVTSDDVGVAEFVDPYLDRGGDDAAANAFVIYIPSPAGPSSTRDPWADGAYRNSERAVYVQRLPCH